MKTEPIDILLVDDNEDDIIIVREALDRAKLLNVIQVVYDGEEAMRYMRGEGEFTDAKQPAAGRRSAKRSSTRPSPTCKMTFRKAKRS